MPRGDRSTQPHKLRSFFGITAVSHKVISKLLKDTCAAAREARVNLQAIQKVDSGDGCDDQIVTRAKNNEAGPTTQLFLWRTFRGIKTEVLRQGIRGRVHIWN